jgi:hypothetical protein
MNDASGHAASENADYDLEVAQAKAAGLKVLAYIETSYGAEPAATVKQEILNHKNWYDVDGFFFDEVSSLAADLAYYNDLRTYVNANMAVGKRTIVLNHGTEPDQGYLDAGDILVTFEGTAAAYASATFPAWQAAEDIMRFAHIVYAAATLEPSLTTFMGSPAAHIYITNDVLPNPYDVLPTYLETLRAGVVD